MSSAFLLLPKYLRRFAVRQIASSNEGTLGKKDEGPSRERERVPRALLHKYKVFKDEDSRYILDVHEEETLKRQGLPVVEPSTRSEEQETVPVKRGELGVFDLHELVQLLRLDNALDICCVQVPEELRYVDHLVIAGGRSPRHLKALAELVKRTYKLKMGARDKYCRIEGLDAGCKDWLAVDLGNIALHLFVPEARETYDLESLWTVGERYDDSVQRPPRDAVWDALGESTYYLDGSKPKLD